MSAKQVSQIRLPLYRQTGANTFLALTGFTPTVSGNPNPAVQIPTWNVNYRAEMEYLGSPTTRTISGREKANLSAYRLYVDIVLDNSSPTNSAKIRTLLNNISSRFTRTFGATTLQIGEPTVIGVTVEDNTTVVHCNLNSAVVGINRELTIGTQAITISLKSVNLFKEIPSNFILS